MQQIITAKLKLTATKEQFAALRQTQLAYRDALGVVSRYAFEQGKTSNTFQCDSRVSVGTLNGRISVPYRGYDKHLALIRARATIGDAKLWYDRQKKTFYLLVSLSIDVPEPTYEQIKEVVGVDVGIRYLAVTSTSTGKATFHSGKRTRHKANHYARLRKRLQHKGTRGAKRRLRRIEQRERRFKAQANHTLAKQIITEHPHALIGLENLTDIRERTRRKKRDVENAPGLAGLDQDGMFVNHP